MSAAPPWRRLDPAGAPARLLAGGLAAAALAAVTLTLVAPLAARVAQARAELAAEAASVARLERAAAAPTPARADPGQQAEAAAWLARVAPLAGPDAATAMDAAALDLLSLAQALAAQAGARVTSVAPLQDAAADAPGAMPDPALGLSVAAVEMRVVSDHAALARLLGAVAEAPDVRVVALETRARDAAPLAETDRLSTRLALAGLRRTSAGKAP